MIIGGRPDFYFSLKRGFVVNFLAMMGKLGTQLCLMVLRGID